MKIKNIKESLALIFVIVLLASCNIRTNKNTIETGREPSIEPDYSGVTMPRNVAPMNFIIKEDGNSFNIKISSETGIQLSIHSSDGTVQIPEKSWKELLSDANNR